MYNWLKQVVFCRNQLPSDKTTYVGAVDQNVGDGCGSFGCICIVDAERTGFNGIGHGTLNGLNPPLSGPISLRSSGLGPDILSFSICWCCDLMAKRLTWTGIGTTIFGPAPALPRPRLCEVRPAFTRFHLARRFWNQILTCGLLKFNWNLHLLSPYLNNISTGGESHVN